MDVPTIGIDNERGFYVGITLGAILYGIEIVLFFQSVYYLVYSAAEKSKILYNAYGTVLFILATISVVTNGYFGQLVWIENGDFPGGSGAYYLANLTLWLNTFGTVADAVANILGDALLLYRCYVICGARRSLMYAPSLIWIASTAMAIITNVISGLPDSSVFKGKAASCGVSWVVLTVSFNVVVTTMICARIFSLQRSVRKYMDAETAKMYTGIIALLVESALPFTVLGIIFIATYVRASPAEWTMAPTWGSFVIISPQLIILRVAMGRAWTKTTMTNVTRSLEFAHRTGTSTGLESTFVEGSSTAANSTSLAFGSEQESAVDLQSEKVDEPEVHVTFVT
ncbi:uncharacterized protein EV420DRAFT_168874 [Desarmillaria tabescens]|uniref:Uncharacterized protein n=1 Tax=Armillaria tabescens TaxID=1929756 RepID=A0AA39TQZ2_ARMTA|nr:uncharacterized protein EV420DRAFT_168874 [Desarmillaria tabescens]KAK0460964.1 hypothetical protein EV420DRAFT_168874 [Desarmillaria tabescens]